MIINAPQCGATTLDSNNDSVAIITYHAYDYTVFTTSKLA